MLSPLNTVNPQNRLGPTDFESTRALLLGKPDQATRWSDRPRRDGAGQLGPAPGWKARVAASVAGILVLAVLIGGHVM